MDILGIGFWELALIFLIAMMVFGPRRLPEVAARAGKIVRDIRGMSQGLLLEWRREITVAARLEELDQVRQELEETKRQLGQAQSDIQQTQKDIGQQAKEQVQQAQETVAAAGASKQVNAPQANAPVPAAAEADKIPPEESTIAPLQQRQQSSSESPDTAGETVASDTGQEDELKNPGKSAVPSNGKDAADSSEPETAPSAKVSKSKQTPNE